MARTLLLIVFLTIAFLEIFLETEIITFTVEEELTLK